MLPCATKAQEGCQEAWPSPASALCGRQRIFFAGLRTCCPGTLLMPACSCNLPPRPKQPATAGFEPAPGRGVECFRVPPRLKKGAKKRGQARLRPCAAAKGFFLAGFEPAARAPSKVLYGYKNLLISPKHSKTNCSPVSWNFFAQQSCPEHS